MFFVDIQIFGVRGFSQLRAVLGLSQAAEASFLRHDGLELLGLGLVLGRADKKGKKGSFVSVNRWIG